MMDTSGYNKKYFDNKSADEVLGAVKPPCGTCTERFLACHDTCPKYKEYKAEILRYKQYIKDVRQAKFNHW